MKIWLPAIQAGTGVDVFTQRLASALTNHGHTAIIEWIPARYELTPWKLKQITPPANTDIIHAGSWHGYAHQQPDIPLVITEHHFIKHPAFKRCTTPAQRLYHNLHISRLVRKSYRAANAVTAVSQTTAEAMIASGFCQKSVNVIYNWVNTSVFAPKPRPRSTASAPWKIIFIGNPSYWKGADLIPTIAKELGSSFNIYCLGGLRSRYTARRLPENVFPIDPVSPEDMPELYSRFDTVLVPARYEAFGYVALEAMACGIPVVGFANTGTNEVCINHETALLSDTDDIQALCDNVRKLRDDPELRLSLATQGRLRAQSEFNEHKSVSKYLEIYKRIIR